MNRDDVDRLAITLEEIRSFRKEILLMKGVLASDIVEHHSTIKQVVDRFVLKGLDRLWLEQELAPFVDTEIAQDAEMLEAYLLDTIESMIVSLSNENEADFKKAHIFIGATGVGKSTLIAKIAARYCYLLNPPHKVALLNRDFHKLGAEDQLIHYSEAMDIPLLDEKSSFEEYDLLLVDTSGVHHKSEEELIELITKIKEKGTHQVEISLVLSATARESDMVQLMNRFDGVEIKSFMITKLDETEYISDMIRFLMRYPKPIRYFSIGQEIPEDLMVASTVYLMDKFMKRRD